jgi:hypothetical protein
VILLFCEVVRGGLENEALGACFSAGKEAKFGEIGRVLPVAFRDLSGCGGVFVDRFNGGCFKINTSVGKVNVRGYY